MTVAAADIGKYSPYEVKEGTQFSNTLFSSYSVTAKALLDEMIPPSITLESATYDYCHALMICHLYTLKLGTIEVRSTRPEEWTFVQPGITSYYLAVKAVIQNAAAKAIDDATTYEEETRRADSDMTEMHLDQAEVPVYFEE